MAFVDKYGELGAGKFAESLVDEGVEERVAKHAENVEVDLNLVQPYEGFSADPVHSQ